jgi:hypothetical protein
MTVRSNSQIPSAGVWTQRSQRRRWVRDPRRRAATLPHACRGEQWHLLRVPGDGNNDPPFVTAEFLHADGGTSRQLVALQRLSGDADPGHWLGWVQAPADAGYWRLESHSTDATAIAAHRVAERDVKCHPLANVPLPESHRTPFPIERIVLPECLAALAPQLDGSDVQVIKTPRSLRELAKTAMGCACVLDPLWVDALNLTLRDIERIVPITWLIVDLPTMARLVTKAGEADARVRTQRSAHGLMSARVEYADVPTRGFALMDVFPFGVHTATHGFALRVLEANRSWKRYASECGFALVLSSHTPFEKRGPDVLCAMRAIGQGELIATDLPWLAAGLLGPPVAPMLARHALRMHLGSRLATETQYWTRWDDARVVLRDISDLSRRYPPLEGARWRSDKPGLASLGLTLPCDERPARNGPPRHFVIRTGRTDQCEQHDGLPPEPLMIVMRQLARDWQAQTDWARRHLKNARVSWQFEAADGLRYGVLFHAGDPTVAPTATLTVRTHADAHQVGAVRRTAGGAQLLVPAGVGVFGDRSLDYQARLTAAIRGWITDCAAR